VTLPDARVALDADAARAAFDLILDGDTDAGDLSRFLVAMAERGETPTEIAAAASAMRERMIKVEAPEDAIDVCGTGGDGSHTLNVSTAVAIVVAAAGVPVAKHGNRAASSKAGAADTLEALGVRLDLPFEAAEAALAEFGIAFLFAQRHHPALARVAPVRKALGRRTVFNLLGPLCNPACVTRQLIGVAHPDIVPPYGEAMALLGYERAMTVSGWDAEDADGGFVDELSLAGGNAVRCVGLPAALAEVPTVFARQPVAALRGGDAAYNAAALTGLLDGVPGAYRDAVLLNAAGAFIVADRAADWEAGIDMARESIDSGAARDLLARWAAFR
jgi:anthranilate phosphoribosyltransferase